MSKKIRNFLGVILLSVFFGQFFCSTLFPHVHNINGVVIVHSHPYNIFEKNHHQHSEEEIVVIHHLSHAVFTAPTVLSPAVPPIEALVLPMLKKMVFADVSPILHSLLRAPPFVGSK